MQILPLINSVLTKYTVRYIITAIIVITRFHPGFSQSYGLRFGDFSPEEIRQDILSSFLFKGIEVFYGTDSQFRVAIVDTSITPNLSDAQKQELKTLTQEMFKTLQKEYKSKRTDLESFFDFSLPKNLKATLEMPDNRAGAGVQLGKIRNDQVLTYRVDISYAFLKDNFRASIASNLSEALLQARLDTRTDTSQVIDSTVTEEQIIEMLMLIREVAETTDFSQIFGNNQQFMETALTMEYLSYVADAVRHVDQQFYGTILWGIAHEFGHIALNTVVSPPVNEREANWFKNKELDADKFATYLLTDAYLITGVVFPRINGYFMAFMEKELAMGFLGYGVYFGTAYELTYKSYMGAYPSPEDRSDLCKTVFNSAYSTYIGSTMKKADRAATISNLLQKRPDVVSKRFKWIN